MFRSVNRQTLITEAELPGLAKQFRENAGKSRAEAARDLKVARPTVHQAEENPELSLFKLRKRIIEAHSPYRLEGPFYRLVKK
jgi:DNA-binding XRE family transcriptional regulator